MKKSKVLKAGLGYTIGNILLKGLNFLTIPIFTRVLSTSDYGIYNTYVAFESILCIIIGLGLYSSLKNAIYDFKNKYKEYLSSVVLLVLFSYIGVTLILNFFFPIYKNFFDFDRVILNILILHSFGTALISFYNQELSLKYDYKKFMIISFINIMLNISLSFLLILFIFPSKKWLGRILGSAIPYIIIGLNIIINYFMNKKPKIDKRIWNYSLKISLPIVPHVLSQIILSQFDRIMIKRIVSASAAGIYSFLYNISTILITISESLETVWCPWFFEKMNKKEYETIKTNYRRLLSGVTIIFISIILLSPEIIKIMGSKDYWEGIYCVYPIIIATYLAFIYHFPANVEYYYKKTIYIAIGTFMAAITNIFLNIIFIPKHGYVAAAYTTLISYLLYFIFHFIIYKKITSVNIYNIYYFIFHFIEIIIISLISAIFINNIIYRIILLLFILFIYAIYYRIGKIIIKHTKN